MTDTESEKNALVGTKEDIRTLVEWQQQRYHQVQNVSLALLSGFLTILAIVATILAPLTPSLLISFPQPEIIEQAADNSLFGYAAISSLVILNYLLSIFIFILSGVFGFFGIYKLYNIVSNPPLEPHLNRLEVYGKTPEVAGILGETGVQNVQNKLYASFDRNKPIIESTRRDFKMALVRLPIALFGGHYAIQLYFHTVSLNLTNMLLYDTALLLPGSISALIIGKILSKPESKDSEPVSIAQELFKKDGGRFPTELISPEGKLILATELFGFLILLTVALELGWKFLM